MESDSTTTKSEDSNLYCIALGCLNTTENAPDLSFFTLPKDSKSSREWLTAVKRDDLLSNGEYKNESYKVCAFHFEPSAFKTINLLKVDAVPKTSVQNGKQPHLSCLHTQARRSDLCTQTEPAMHALSIVRLQNDTICTFCTGPQTPGPLDRPPQTSSALADEAASKRKLEEQLESATRKRQRLDHCEELEENNTFTVSNHPGIYVVKRIKMLNNWRKGLKRKLKEDHYIAAYKRFAFNLHCASPNAHGCLRTVLKLPSMSTLKKLQLGIPPKLDKRVMQWLSLRLKSLPDKAKYCTLTVDYMDLKRHLYYDTKFDEVIGFHNINGKVTYKIANYAYAIMLQGIYTDWKQLVAYSFFSGLSPYTEINAWIDKLIAMLYAIGIEVKAVITNQDNTFDRFAKCTKKIIVDKPYFFVDGRKVYYIFDVPNLLMSLRNRLLAGYIHYQPKSIASWDYIRVLYTNEKEKECRLIPKVTDDHLDPDDIKKTQLKYATQIFSRSVYAALEMYIEYGKITDKAKPTVEFVQTFNDLFDVLNSSKMKSGNELKTAFRMTEAQQKNFENALNLCTKMEKNKMFVNFRITINSIQQLFADLKADGFDYLLTRRLNQDNLRLFFESVRERSGAREATAVQFTRAFNRHFLGDILNTAPCTDSEDLIEILLKAEEVKNTDTSSLEDPLRTSLVGLNGETDYRMELPQTDALKYVACYLFYKFSLKHNCYKFGQLVKSLSRLDETELFAQYKDYNKKATFYANLKMPPEAFHRYVEKLEDTFAYNFDKVAHSGAGHAMYQLLEKIPPPFTCCTWFPIDYLLKLFVRLRIFATLKLSSRCFREAGAKSVQLYMKVKHL